MLSRSQVDKIGEQLRRGDVDASALTKLSEYQTEFNDAYSYVERLLTTKMYLTITGRPAKSTLSIIEKLRRIKSRLSQIQDISGCRAIVPSLEDQEEVIRKATEWFPYVVVDDKRIESTHGYRAVHLLVTHRGKCVEVQVRTRIQHFWATISEKLSDTYGQEIKYGSGNPAVLGHLMKLSEVTRKFDIMVDRLAKNRRELLEVRARGLKSIRVSELKKAIKTGEADLREAMYAVRGVLIEFDKMEEDNVLPDKLQ